MSSSPVVSGDSDELGGSSSSDSVDSSLHSGQNVRGRNVIWLIHKSEDDLRVVLVEGSELTP